MKKTLLIISFFLSLSAFENVKAQYVLSEDFSSATFPPAGWTRGDGMTQGLPPAPASMPDYTRSDASAYGIGNGSALAYFYDIAEGDIDSLTTPVFTPSSVNDSLYFDEAYKTYIDEVDELRIRISTDGGNTFTTLASLYGGDQVGTGMVTAEASTDIYVAPLNSEWASKKFALPIGVNKIRFQIFSAVGNNLFIDNIKVGKPLIALPLSILNFTGNQSGSQVQLNWKINNEVNNSGFEIQKLYGSIWQKINFINSAGNNLSVQDYSINDSKPDNGYNYYRLKQVDVVGKILYSDIVKVNFNNNAAEVTIQNYPNPFTNYTLIHYLVPSHVHVKISFYDIQGKPLVSLVDETKERGSYTAIWNAKGISAGTYFYKIIIGDKIYSGRAVKTD